MRLLWSVVAISAAALACSNFFMDNDPYRISVRTMDLRLGEFDMVVESAEGGAKYGRVGFVAGLPRLVLQRFQTGGLNEVGVSCDQQTLLNASYPISDSSKMIVTTDSFCAEALANYSTARELEAALSNGSLGIVAGFVKETHFVVRDALGDSLVVEALDGQLVTRLDLNDDGRTGFGILTNEPPFDVHVANVRHFKWKQTLQGSAVTIPGAWYPDERFLRIYVVKKGMEAPTSYVTAVQQAIHVLNTITVPMGNNQLGTDSSAGERRRDHTLYGVIYDHLNAKVYWRTYKNTNLQLLDLPTALQIAASAGSLVMPVVSDNLPWYNDATPVLAALRPDPQRAN